MSGDWLDLPVGPARARLEQLSRQAKELPAEAEDLVEELLEAFAVSLEELQVAAEELQQQNQELLATREEVVAGRRRYRDLFELAPDGYLVTDSAGVITDANQAAVDLVRVPKQELVGKPLVLYIAPDDRERFHLQLDRLVEGRRTGAGEGEWELQVRPRRGQAFPAALSVTSIRDAQDRTTGLLWLLRDISASKRAVERERLLREARTQRRAAVEARRLLEALMDAMPVGTVVSDAAGAALQTNATARAMLGSDVHGSVGSPERLYTAHYPDGTPFPSEDMPLAHALKEGEIIRNVEVLIRRPDGEERTILAGAAPVLDEEGEVVRAITAFQDITALKRAEEALQEERDRLAALINSIRDEIWFADATGRFTLVNPAARGEFDLQEGAPADIRELAASLQVFRSDGTPRPVEETPPLRALRGEVVVNEEELIRTPATGELRHRQVSATPVLDGGGNIIGSVSVVRDVTALKQVEEEREWLLSENRRQRAFLEQLIETAPLGLAVVRGPDHRYEMVNPAYQAIPGMPGVPMVGRTIAQVFPDVAAQGALSMVEQVYQTGEAVSARRYEASVGAGRERTYWDVDHVPLWGADGAVESVLIVADEVTDEVMAQRRVQDLAEQLGRERDLLRTIMENTPTQLAYLDLGFRFVMVNSAYAEGSGHTKDELVGRDHFDLFPDPENRAIFEQVRDTGEPVEFHARPFEFADQPDRGTTYWDWTLVPVKNRNGQVQGLVLSLMDVTDVQRLLMDLDAERARLRAVIENAPEGIVVADEACRIVLANPAAERLHVRPVPYGQELSSHADLAFCHVDGTRCDPRDLPLTRSALDGETIIEVEMAICWPDGRTRDLLVSTAPIRGQRGQLRGAVGVFQDITERNEAQRALQLLAERLHILHAADRVILSADSVDEIVEAVLPVIRELSGCQWACVVAFDREANEAILLGLETDIESGLVKGTRVALDEGWPAHELAKGDMSLVGDISDLPVSPSVFEDLRQQEVRSLVSVPLVVQGELLGALNLSMEDPRALTSEHREIIRQMADQLAIGLQQMGLHQEVQRYAAQLEEMVARRTAALAASEARFRTIFEDSALGKALLNARGQIVACNPALRAMLDRSEEELVGTRFARYSHPDDAQEDQDLFQSLVDGELGFYHAEKRFVRKDGEVRWSELTVSRLTRTEPEEPGLAIAMLSDVTEKRMNQEALMRAERLAIAGRLGASLAHEINNPLQSVIGSLGLAEEMVDDGAEVRRYLELAMEELERAAGIVSQLRDLSRDPKVTEAKPADLNALVEKVLLLTRKDCLNRGIEVAWSPGAGVPAVPLVSERMRQVFLNLILNAIEAMPDGGQLHVSTAPTGEPSGVRVSVADTGQGIEPDRLPWIFEPFHSSRPEGLGLGLYISKNIAEEHRGQIDVDSHPGEGTTFTVWLPA